MASAKQQTFRRLMKEQKGSEAKVDHPLAKYNSVGQLTCAVCSVPVKNGIVWPAHLQSRRHKEAVTALKLQCSDRTPHSSSGSRDGVRSGEGTVVRTGVPAKRKAGTGRVTDLSSEVSAKKSKSSETAPSSLPSDFFDSSTKPAVTYSDSESEEEEHGNGDTPLPLQEEVDHPPKDALNSEKPSHQLPEKTEDQEGVKRRPSDGALPEGFFDDPVKDAKARKVQFKDAMEEEWERFQKSIQQEEKASLAIQEEDDTTAKDDRELEEVKEQVAWYTRAEVLRQRQETLLAQKAGVKEVESDQEMNDSGSGVDSDFEYDDLLDWRRKRT